MPPISTTDALEAGLELGASPPRAADGGPELSPAPVSLPVIQPMSLCDVGPCRNLHVLTQKIDAERPLDGSPAPVHTVTSRTCYPAPGIEYDLTSEPVKSCSRWFPETAESTSEITRARDLATIDRWNNVRDDYKAFLKSWELPDAEPLEPIPAGVYYAIDTDNFYSVGTRRGQGVDFYEKWKSRALEFPTR